MTLTNKHILLLQRYSHDTVLGLIFP